MTQLFLQIKRTKEKRTVKKKKEKERELLQEIIDYIKNIINLFNNGYKLKRILKINSWS